METANPDHPPPVLFVVASLPMAVGLPLYEAVKQKADDALLDVLEPVVTDPAFVREMQAAIQQAPHLSDVARRHLVTACDWLGQRSYVDAYPPFYNGLESGFTAVARNANIIDSDNRFVVINPPAKRASKVEDLFMYLPMDARYRRFLRAWIFGDRGNPFRHGDVSDPDDCRRQSLRLGVATIGWLETFGGWSGSSFQTRLETEALRQAS